MLRSHGISQIYHTYSEDHVYPPLQWLLRGVTEGYVRVHILLVGVVYPILMQRVLYFSVYFIIVNAISMNRTSIIRTPLIVQSQVLL